LGSSAYIFLDAAYAELGIGFGYGMMSKVVKRSAAPITDKPDFGDLWQLDLSVLGKYPFKLGAFSPFPLLGVSYKCVLFSKEPITGSMPYENKKFNQFGILAGIGFDHDLVNSLYLRAEALFHFRFPMEFVIQNLQSDAFATFGYGGRIKVGIGYKF
jgi:outer membrane protein W